MWTLATAVVEIAFVEIAEVEIAVAEIAAIKTAQDKVLSEDFYDTWTWIYPKLWQNWRTVISGQYSL